jgi:hypothetical protein
LIHPDPEEQERDGSAARGRSTDNAGDEQGDVDAAFARIVAGLQAEPEERRWPVREPVSQPEGDLASDLVTDTCEDHFDPPEPPLLPKPRPRTIGGMLTLTVGVLLLAGPNLLGLGERVALPLGLLAVTAGIGWLVIGLRPDLPFDGSDDGARL